MSITVKVLDATSEVASYTFNEGQALVVNSTGKVNFQLIDDNTGFAPQNILAKREGNNLVVFLDDGNEEADIILEDFYREDELLLIGQHENGNLYAYVPESNQSVEAISQLAEEMVAPQALGGTNLATPLYVFYPYGLLGLLGVAVLGGAALAAVRRSHNADYTPVDQPEAATVTSNADGSVTIDLPANAKEGDTVTVGVTTPNGTQEQVTLTKKGDTWESSNPAIVPSTQAGSNQTIIPDEQVKDGSTVTTDTSEKVAHSGVAANPIPNAPTISTPDDKTGDVVVGLPTKNVEPGDQVEISYTKPNGEKATVVATKQPDGSWTTNNANLPVSTDANGNPVVVLPNSEVKDGSDVTAVSKDAATGETSTPTTEKAGNPLPAAPTISAPDHETGIVTVTLPTENVEPGDTVEISYTKPNGEKATVVATKQPDGSWTTDNPNLPVTTDANGNPVIVLPNNEVKDNSDVTAVSKDANSGESSTPATEKAGDPVPTAPKIVPQLNGDVWLIDLPTDAEPGDVVVIKFKDPDGNDIEVTLTKQPDGSWKAEPAIVDFDENGNVVIPTSQVKDGTPINAESYNEADKDKTNPNASEPATSVDVAPDAPVVKGPDHTTGDVVVELPTNNVETGNKVTIDYTAPNGDAKQVVIEKVPVSEENPTGWQIVEPADNPDGVQLSLDENGNPVATIPGDKVKDGSEVTAVASDENNAVEGKGEAGDPDPSAPVITTDENGGVTIELPADAEPGDVVKVIYTDKNGDTVVTTVVKNPDGTWSDEDPNTTIEGDTLTIPGDKIKDGTDVTAVAVNADKVNPALETDEQGNYVAPEPEKNPENLDEIINQGNSDTKTTEDPLPDSPTVNPNTDGSVTIINLPENAEPGDKVIVEYTKPNGEQAQAVLTKQEDGTWAADPNNPDVVVDNGADGSTASIANDKVKDGTEVKAYSTNAADENNENGSTPDVKETVDNPPEAPTVTADEEMGDVVIKLPVENVEPGDKVTIEYTDPEGNPQSVELTKTEDGWEVTGGTDAGKEAITLDKDGDGVPDTDAEGNPIATLPGDKVKDGTPVTAIAEDGTTTGENAPKGEENAPDRVPEAPVVVVVVDDSVEKNNPDAVITLPTEGVEIGDYVEVGYIDKDGNGHIATIVKTPDGWKSNDPNVVVSDDGTTATIDGDLLQPGSEVVAVTINNSDPATEPASETVKDATEEEIQDLKNKGNSSSDNLDKDLAPAQPAVTANEDGSVDVTMPTENVEPGDKVDVDFTKPDGTPASVTYVAQPDGTWKAEPAEAATNNGLPETVEPAGTIVLPNELVDDKSEVVATAYDETTPKADVVEPGKAISEDPAPAQPAVTANEDGSVDVTMPTENVEPGDKVDVDFTKPDGTPASVTYVAQPDGTWKAEPAEAATENGLPETLPEAGTLTLPNELVDDGTDVTATAYDEGNPKDQVTGKTEPAKDPAPAQPAVTANEDGSVDVTMPTENVEPGDKVDVDFTKPDGTPASVTYVAQPDGTWKAEPAEVATENGLPETLPEAGTLTLPNELVDDGTDVTATTYDEGNPKDQVTGKTEPAKDPAPAQPAVTANEDGSVDVTMPTENVEPGDKVDVDFTKPDGTPASVTYVAQPDGTWKAEPAEAATENGLPETLPEAGTLTLPNELVDDGKDVTATAYDEGNPKDQATGMTEPAKDPDPAQPTVEADAEGNTAVTFPTENVEPNDTVEISFTKPGETEPTTVTYVAQPDGTWKAEPEEAATENGLPTTVDEAGTVTLPNELTKDDSPVQAVAKDETLVNPEVTEQNSAQTAQTPVSQPTFGEEADPANPTGDVVINLPTDAEAGDKVDVTFTKPDGTEETVTLTKQPDGTWAAEPADSGIVLDGDTATLPNDIVKDGSTVSAVAYDEAQDAPTETPITTEAGDPKPTGLEMYFDENGNIIANLPTENVEPGDKVVVTITDPNGAETQITFEKTPEGWTVSPEDKGITIEGDKATIPVSEVPNNSDVIGDTINGNDGLVSEEKEATNKVQTDKPTVTDVFAIDTSNPADDFPELLKVSGKTVDPESLVEIVYQGEVIGSGYSDKDGNFEIIATPTAANPLTIGDEVEVYATDVVNDKLKSEKADGLEALDENGNPTGVIEPISVPEVIDGQEGHIGDRTAPKAPTLAQGIEPGSVVLTFPTEDILGNPIQEGDVVEVNFTDENDQKQIVLFTKTPEGWVSDSPELIAADSGEGLVTGPTVTLKPDLLKDGSTVAAQTRDIAGNESDWDYTAAGSDTPRIQSPDPAVEPIVAYDTSEQADRDPEYILIQGNVTYPAGTPDAGSVVANGIVTVTFPNFVQADGTPVSTTVVTDAQGNFSLIVKESDTTPVKAEHENLDTLSLKDEFNLVAFDSVQFFSEDVERGYLPSYVVNEDGSVEGYPIVAEILPVLDGADYHIGDSTLPTQPTLTPADSGDITNPDGGMVVGLPLDAVAGDKVILEFTDEEGNPQKVTLTKQDDGSWKSDNSLLVPDAERRADEVKIPEDSILDGSEVTAYSEDLAGNVDKDAEGNIVKETASAGSDDYDPTKTATPTYSAVEAFDTAGDSKPEAVTITGTTEPNAEVVVYKDGVEVGRVTADETGAFTLPIDNTDGTLSVLDKLDMIATAPNKLPSDPADVQVPRIVPATAPAIIPNEGGSVVILPQGNDTKVTIKYFDENNVEKTTIVEKDPETGLWYISGDNTKVDADGHTDHDPSMIDFDTVTGGVTIYEPSLQDVDGNGNATTVTAIGNNGNKSTYDRTTTAQVKSVSALEFSNIKAYDSSVAADDDPEEISFTITTQEVSNTGQINTVVEVISPTGEVYEVKNIVEEKDLNGTTKITVKEESNPGLDLQVGSLIRVTQTTADRDPTTKFFSVPELQQGAEWHYDETPPEAPVITPDGNGGATITLPTQDTYPGDKVVVSIVPEGQTEPVEVTLVKVPEGWISDNPALIPSTVGQADPDSVFIPHNRIADDSELGAKSVGTEGLETPAVPAQIGGFTADIDEATITGQTINEGTAEQAKQVEITLDDMVDNDPDAHNAQTLTIELPLVTADGEKVTATLTFDVLNDAVDTLRRFQLTDSGILSNEYVEPTSTGAGSRFTLDTATGVNLADGREAFLDPEGIVNAITQNAEGEKAVSYDLATLELTPYVEPQTNAPTLLGQPDEEAGLVALGEVKITPDADNDAMQITYPIEYGNGQTATILAQKDADGTWKLYGPTVDYVNQNGEKMVDIDPVTGVVTLHPDAVDDLKEVTAVGLKEGKQPSDVASVIAGQEPASIGEFWGTVNDLLPYAPTVGQDDNIDVGIWRLASRLQGSQNSPLVDSYSNAQTSYGRSDALVRLVEQLKAQGDYLSETTVNGIRATYTLNTNSEDNIVRIYNSLGNMNSNHHNDSGIMNMNTGDGNDAIVIGRDLGFSGTSSADSRYINVNTGEGNDIIFVGATNDWFKVVQYYDYNEVTGKYDIPGQVDLIDYDAPLPANARYLPNLDLYNDVSGAKRTGGHLANANVNMGNGDDALVVSGVDSVTAAAISYSKIDLGEGNNSLLISPNGVGNSLEKRGAIAEGSEITAGSGKDYLQAPLITANAKVDLGAGDDTVKVIKVGGTAQVNLGDGNDVATFDHLIERAVIDMGNGNDVVTVTGSMHNSVTVNLGAGDDRFNWGFTKSAGGIIEGGDGYDVISLQGYSASDSSPVGWRATQQVTNIQTSDFNDVEEIILNGNNALDIYFADMRDSATYSFRLDNGATKNAKFIVSANKEADSVVDSDIASNKVDFGAGNWNRDTATDLADWSNGRSNSWSQVDTVSIGGVNYDVYRYSGATSADQDVLVQQGITII